MEIVWHPEAVAEADAAAAFYRTQQRGSRPPIRKPSQRSARTPCIQAGDLSRGGTRHPQDPVEGFSIRRDLSDPRAPNRDHRGDAHTAATRLLAGENLTVSA